MDFLYITGIEDTFVSRTDARSQRSLDEYELTQHYQHMKEDLLLISETGFRHVRYGVPWYLVNPGKGVFDWAWTDRVMDTLHGYSLNPIIDFIHYGTPHWMSNSFINAFFHSYMRDYILAFLDRYDDLVTHYTPMNEPYITQEFCGQKGNWPPYLEGYDGFVKLLMSTAEGIVSTVQSVKEAFPEKIALHVEASGMFFTSDPSLERRTELENELRFLTYDLITGRVTENHKLYAFLLENGAGIRELEWFEENSIAVDAFGVNYYPQLSVYELKNRGNGVVFEGHYGGIEYLRKLLLEYSERYGGPIYLTETSINGSVEHQIRWWTESTSFMLELQQEGVDVQGYTWFPAMDLINWDYRYGAGAVEEYLEPMGFIKLEMDSARNFTRRLSPLADVIRNDLKALQKQ